MPSPVPPLPGRVYEEENNITIIVVAHQRIDIVLLKRIKNTKYFAKSVIQMRNVIIVTHLAISLLSSGNHSYPGRLLAAPPWGQQDPAKYQLHHEINHWRC